MGGGGGGWGGGREYHGISYGGVGSCLDKGGLQFELFAVTSTCSIKCTLQIPAHVLRITEKWGGGGGGGVASPLSPRASYATLL